MQTTLTAIFQRINQGDAHAASDLLPVVYEELRILAARKMAHESPGQTLQATAAARVSLARRAA